ncbi:hypothetical protein [Teredinibacter haidensis]|uniref:hypothetical protein n=1 Tax=Teredinibacter haidensis TaxID=2731755 RepID=UPI0009490F71|nr:hypothetical protein [Teredinibacter haidensis]
MKTNAPQNNTASDAVDSNTPDKLLAVGQQRIHVNAVTTKISDDIAFLRDRIQRMEAMKAPNETVLNTYRAMLASRQSVLKWLKEHNMTTTKQRGKSRSN